MKQYLQRAILPLIFVVSISGGLLFGFFQDHKTVNIASFIEKRFSKPTPTPTTAHVLRQYPLFTPTPTPDADPVVECEFTYLGVKKMKLSQCKRTTECEIEPGHWYLYSSVEKCKQDQNAYWASQPTGNNGKTTASEPLVDCFVSIGTYKLTQSSCNSLKSLESSLKQQYVDWKADNEAIKQQLKNNIDALNKNTYQPGNIDTTILVPTIPGITSIPLPKECYTIGNSNTTICK